MIDHKPRIAFFDFTGCEGCQLSVIDALQTHIGLLDAVEIVQFREAMSEQGGPYEIAFVEGSCTRSVDEERLKTIRANAQLVIVLGSCAHLGGVNTLVNRHPSAEVRSYVYGPSGKRHEIYAARPVDAVIPVDGYVPGCPIDRQEFARTVTTLLQGRRPGLAELPVCVECKLSENPCLVLRGEACLGTVARGGCRAICPNYGTGCAACRGLLPGANLTWLETAQRSFGVSPEAFAAKTRLFLSYQLMENEDGSNGNR
jgi:sulfhydrogenase subunit delta